MDYQLIQERIVEARRDGTLNYDWFQTNFTLEERIELVTFSHYFAAQASLMFTEEEILNHASELFEADEYAFINYTFPVLSDKNKLRYLFQIQNQPEIEDTIYFLSTKIQSDDYKLEALHLLRNKDKQAELVAWLESDEKKQKLLPSYHGLSRAIIIASMKSDQLKEKYIHLAPYLYIIISSLESDELRNRYLQRYQFVLSGLSKAEIIKSFRDEKIKIEYLKKIKNEDERVAIIKSLSSKSKLEFIPTIVDADKRRDIIYTLEESEILTILPTLDKEEAFRLLLRSDIITRDQPKVPFLKRYNQEQIATLLITFKDTSLFLENVSLIKDFATMESLIAHREDFPPYFESYQPLVDLFAQHYQVPIEHLLTMINLTSMQCLSYLNNENIQQILRLPEEDFKKILALFKNENTQLSDNAFNDTLNSLLQRQFRIEHPSLVNIFPRCLAAIEAKDIETLGKLLIQISKTYPYTDLLEKAGMDQETFIRGLLEKQEQKIVFLRQITNKYLTLERNNYTKENLEKMRKRCLKKCFEKNASIKVAMRKIPWEYLLEYVDSLSIQFFSSEDRELLANEDLLKEVFLFKRNPTTYGKEVTKEMKQAFKAYQHIFHVLADRGLFNGKSLFFTSTYELPDKDPQFLLSILGELDVKHLLSFSKENPDLYQKMVEMLEKYQFMAWGETFNSFLEEIDLYFDPSTVANLINNFSEFYPRLEKSIERGEISGVTITGLIDRANCYGSDSYLYSKIFGKEDYQLLSSNPGPNSASMKRKDRLDIALKKVKKLYQRDSIPVPPIQKVYTLPNGKTILVEVGNVTDMRNLTLGERTGACMRIGGAGESLFDFCLEDPNGFHITFSDPETGQLISRVSGFQNGNCCCLNQLRDSLSGKYTGNDLVSVCRMVADDLLEESKQSSHPIDCVIVSDGYAVGQSKEHPRNLPVANIKEGLGNFYSDVYSTAIVLAERKGSRIHLGREKVERYAPVRPYPKRYEEEKAQEAVQHMECLRQHLNGVSLDEIEIPNLEKVKSCYIGADWYVALLSNGETIYTVFEQGNLKRAQAEMAEVLPQLGTEITNQGGFKR